MEELGRMYGIRVPKTIIEINGAERVGVAAKEFKARKVLVLTDANDKMERRRRDMLKGKYDKMERRRRDMLKGKYGLVGLVITLVLCLALSSASSAADQQGVANKVITIGLSSVLSGPATVIGQVSTGMKVYLNKLNREGGVNGYTFKIVERDNANQAAQGVAVVQQLVNQDKVFLLAHFGTPGAQALVPIASSLKLPIMAFCDSDLVKSVPNMFGFTYPYSTAVLFEAQFLIKNLGIKEVAYLYGDDASGRPALAYLPTFVPSIGGTLVGAWGFPLDTTDWAPYATKAKGAGAKGVFVFNATLPLIQKAAQAIGYSPTWVGNYGSLTPSYLKLAGSAAEGTYIDAFIMPIDADDPEVEKYRVEMKAAGKENELGTLTGLGWTMGCIAQEGVRRATASGGSLTWDSYMNALNTIKDFKVGLSQAINYTPQNHSGSSKALMYQVKNGKFVQILSPTELPNPKGN